MNIKFNDTLLTECQEEFNKLDPELALAYSHFELAELTSINDKDRWVNFLKDTRVSESLKEELQLYKESQQRKLIQLATTHDKSVGTAQMINALGKAKEDGADKSGSIFVYTYVPPNIKETHSPYVTAETEDVFEEGS